MIQLRKFDPTQEIGGDELCSREAYVSSLSKPRGKAAFDGGEVTSDGGALLLRKADQQLCLTAAVGGYDTRRSDF